MTRNPFLNAVSALIYIIFIATVMSYGSKLTPHPNQFIAPVAIISLFTGVFS